MSYKNTLLASLTLILGFCGWAQKSSAEIYKDLQKLNFLGSVLYVAAHPDDENTALISYFATHKNASVAYLSLTRGDGGQNLIGTEIREGLGVIRTQELLEARKVDGGQQFFSSAIDFGFSKNPKETLAIWDEKAVLGEVIYRIRAFEPDIIINRFDHRTPGRTHGHHTSSAILSKQAFELSNSKEVYPEQLTKTELWQPKRLFFNTSWWFYGSREKFAKADKTNLVTLEINKFNPYSGKTNMEVAAASRSNHKSQGFGSSPSLGERIEYLELIEGEKITSNNPFEGIDTTWSRVEGGEPIGRLVNKIIANYNFTKPSASVSYLLDAKKMIENLSPSVWKTRKLAEVHSIISNCLGIEIQANAKLAYATVDENVSVDLKIVQQSTLPVELVSIEADKQTQVINESLGKNKLYSKTLTLLASKLNTPYWLLKKGSLGKYKIEEEKLIGLPSTPNSLFVEVNLTVSGVPISYSQEVVYRETDPVRGEVVTPFYVVPDVGANVELPVYFFTSDSTQTVSVDVTNYGKQFKGSFILCTPNGWDIQPEKIDVDIQKRGFTQKIDFEVTPTENAEDGLISPLLKRIDQEQEVFDVSLIDYDHIHKNYIALPSESKLVKIDLKIPKVKVGYLQGAGDLMKESLEDVGVDIENIDIKNLSLENIKSYDAILVGIRAFNVLDELKFKNKILWEYAKQGGTLIVQYNTNRRLKTSEILPYPITISRDRVTNEDSYIRILNPESKLFNVPNKITKEDFKGWEQERGLYFANKWGEEYTPLLEMNDEGESKKYGSLLVAPYGKGNVVYTGISFFRQLPAGVPGAYKLIINMISY